MPSAPTHSRKQSRHSAILSPLRYPGGKRRLAGYISEALQLNGLHPKVFVEPFAGGASVSLQLLAENRVEEIVLGEFDPLVASLWKTVMYDHEWLVDRIRNTEPTLENWKRFRQSRPTDERERALVCLFLNRTSFSGILSDTAGPIGGWSQASDHKIDCRFPVETIIERIRQISGFRERVRLIHEGDWAETMAEVEKWNYDRNEVFFYLDPPFYQKADRLYRYYFGQSDHNRLYAAVKNLKPNYILSYDPAEPVMKLYAPNGTGPKRVELLYSATQSSSLVRAQELIISNLAELPQTTRLWQTSGKPGSDI